jgi:hypothetical protein
LNRAFQIKKLESSSLIEIRLAILHNNIAAREARLVFMEMLSDGFSGEELICKHG